MAILKGLFTSVWDGGIEVNTPAILVTETGEITAESVDANGLENLEYERFTDEDGEEYEVCPVCHEHIMKPIMVDGIGHNLDEKFVCSDFTCENGEGNL